MSFQSLFQNYTHPSTRPLLVGDPRQENIGPVTFFLQNFFMGGCGICPPVAGSDVLYSCSSNNLKKSLAGRRNKNRTERNVIRLLRVVVHHTKDIFLTTTSTWVS
ncbi:hypothetical protein NPIL_149601 [Nephila pilipes]|uniref:Uncharacterized protein n=1 Tax=Nephila pilipes TaxID=299642 RepID=A0A8X6TFW9_NEPPI|nr:hypothetical protein NPIL_149601 [Nephila pilipes]